MLGDHCHYDDGGREAAGFKGEAGDCVCRAIAIATRIPYRRVYDELHALLRAYATFHCDRTTKRTARGRERKDTTPRNGVNKEVYRPYLRKLGWVWHPTMENVLQTFFQQILKTTSVERARTLANLALKLTAKDGVHLRAGELPTGRLIVDVSNHLVAVIDGVIHDTYDCSREGMLCVHGYWSSAELEQQLRDAEFDRDELETTLQQIRDTLARQS